MIKLDQQCEKCSSYSGIKWKVVEVHYVRNKLNPSPFDTYKSNIFKRQFIEVEKFQCACCGHSWKNYTGG